MVGVTGSIPVAPTTDFIRRLLVILSPGLFRVRLATS